MIGDMYGFTSMSAPPAPEALQVKKGKTQAQAELEAKLMPFLVRYLDGMAKLAIAAKNVKNYADAWAESLTAAELEMVKSNEQIMDALKTGVAAFQAADEGTKKLKKMLGL